MTLGDALELSGLASIVAGGFVLYVWLGLFLAGAALIFLGYSLDASSASDPEAQ
jgi:hypothetical protein